MSDSDQDDRTVPPRPPEHPMDDSTAATDPAAFTHLGPDGEATMVDVTRKPATARRAIARGRLKCSQRAFRLLTEGGNPKGDVEHVARLAGIMGGKRTGELIPLCHMLPAANIAVSVEPDSSLPGLSVTATATITGQTGVEMEALTAAAIALLTAYDMLKSVDRAMTIESIGLVEKSGGRSGSWERPRD